MQVVLNAQDQERLGKSHHDEFITVPYVMDLESANGTCLNNKVMESARYYELRSKDVLRFATSGDYVFMVSD